MLQEETFDIFISAFDIFISANLICMNISEKILGAVILFKPVFLLRRWVRFKLNNKLIIM